MSLESRLVRLERAVPPPPDAESALSLDELTLRIWEVAEGVLNHGEATTSDKEEAGRVLAELRAEVVDWGAFWSRDDIAKDIKSQIAEGHLPVEFELPVFSNGAGEHGTADVFAFRRSLRERILRRGQ
jgi:hypothetical protein